MAEATPAPPGNESLGVLSCGRDPKGMDTNREKLPPAHCLEEEGGWGLTLQ